MALQRLQGAIARPDADIDLALAALHIAQLEYPDLDPAPTLHQLDAIAEAIAPQLPAQRYPLKVIQGINQYLFDELGFAGNQGHYYDPRNSFLNDVVDRRLGIPLTLSIIYLEVASRLGFPMVGVGMPGHFIIRPQVAEMALYVDPFHRGEVMFPEDCERRLEQVYQRPVKLTPELLPEVTPRQCLVRMLTNLKVLYLKEGAFAKAIATIDGLLVLTPDSPMELRDRGLVLYELERWQEAQENLERYLDLLPSAQDQRVIEQLLAYMQRLL